MNKFIALGLMLVCIHESAAAVAGPLTAGQPVVLPGPAGKFDFMAADAATGRILAAHRGNKTLEILDLKTGKPLGAVEVGEALGVAVDPKARKYFVGNAGGHSVAVVDSQSLVKTAEVKLDGPVDAMAFDEKNGMLYAAEDGGSRLWVIDAKSAGLVDTIAIPGIPEVLEYDPKTNRIYLNIKNKDAVVRIDPDAKKVDANWSTLPATSPHGLAIDVKRGLVYSAGGNGKLVAIDLRSGRVVSTVDIPTGVDQIAYDAGKNVVYSACKGFIAVANVSESGLEAVSNVPSPKGAHTIAVDPTSHDVWVSYADENHSYLQRFKRTP